MKRVIYDLDGTVIDSKHRQATLPCGSLDLEHWRENSTPDKIANDSLLPLAEQMRKDWLRAEVIICTARVLSDADYDYLFSNGLYFDHCLSRPENNKLPDAYLKEYLLRKHCESEKLPFKYFASTAKMYDDNSSVIEAMTEIGINTIDARTIQ